MWLWGTPISKIIEENNEHKSYAIDRVKIISQISTDSYSYVVADLSTALPLSITPEYQQILDVDSIYHLLEVKYLDGKLVMNDKSYAMELAYMKNHIIFDTIQQGITMFTSYNLREIHENDKMNGVLIMVLDSIGKTGLQIKPKSAFGYNGKTKTKQNIYRRAFFKDEYRTVSLTAYGDDIKIFDRLNVGKIYKIQYFKTTDSTSSDGKCFKITTGVDPEINMQWVEGKTELQEISLGQTMKLTEHERSRIKLLSNLKSQFTARILNYATPKYYYVCKNCGRLKTTVEMFVRNGVCLCGKLINETLFEKKFNVQFIFCNRQHENCYIVLAFSDEILESLNIKINTNIEFKDKDRILQSLIGLTARVTVERHYINGNIQLIMKTMILIDGKNELDLTDEYTDGGRYHVVDYNWNGSFIDSYIYDQCLIDEEERKRKQISSKKC